MTDYSVPLTEWDITVRMSRREEVRAFRFPRVPAVDEERAMDAGYQLGLGVNEGSGHQWKFNGAGEDHYITVSPSHPLCADCVTRPAVPDSARDDEGGQLCATCERSYS